jgi:Domain of unknown function (DUF4157)
MDRRRQGEREGHEVEQGTASRSVGARTLIAQRYSALAKALPQHDGDDAMPSVHDAATAAVDHKDPGRPVDGTVATAVGAHLSVDFGGVRVHDDALAQEANAAMGARAFAHGSDVFLGAGERGSDLGLMAHELTHVAQQGAAAQRTPQRQVQVGDANSPAEHEADQVSAAVTSGARPATLLVDEPPVGPGQMLKSQFLAQLREQVSAAAAQELGPIYAGIGCPYIDRYFGQYANQPAAAGEAVMRRFAPTTRNARSASDMIPLVVDRVRSGVQVWRDTGQPPAGLAEASPEGATAAAAGTGPGAAQALHAPDGGETLASLEADLGPGAALDGSTASRMSDALGVDVSGARIHTGPIAARKADEAGALAFAVGPNVVMGSSAPAAGSLAGDALLAHELAHTAQQRDVAADPIARRQPIGGEDTAAEGHADAAALGAMAALHGGEKAKGLAARLGGSFKSGLQLQRCQPQQAQHQTTPAVAPPTHVSNQITDGPFGWQQEFDCTIGSGEIRVVLKPKLVADAGVTPEQVASAKTRSVAQFRSVFDNKFVLTDTADHQAYNLRCDAQFVDAGEHYTITLHPGSGGTNRRNWYVSDSDTDLAHELGHQLGLKDEYVDASVPARATATSPGVFHDHSIMGNYPAEGVGQAEVKQRHGETIANEIGGATHRTFTVARR